jgi:hypothetical protein
MSADSEAAGLSGKVRMLAVALLLSAFVVPVIMWWQAGEARAQRAPVQKVAMSRIDLPAENSGPAPETADRETTTDAATQANGHPAPAAPAAAEPVNRAPRPAHLAAPVLPVARLAPPPDPFVPEPAPAGWQPSAPDCGLRIADCGLGNSGQPPISGQQRTEGGTPAPSAGTRPSVATGPQSAIRNPQSAIAVALPAPDRAPARGAIPATPARNLPHSGAQRPVSAPGTQPLAQPAPVPPPTTLGDVRLRGVIRGTPDLALILLDGQTYFLKAGDRVTGTWVVGEIKDNSVVLRSGGHVRELQIEGGSQK